MGQIHQLKGGTYKPLDILATLISLAQERQGNMEPNEVLSLARAAKEAVESLFSDIEQANKEALQEAVLEVFQARCNA